MDTQFYELYYVGEAVYGTPLRGVTTYQLRLQYEYCFELQGQTAHYFCVTREDGLGRADALKFAADDAQGRLVHIHIDLSEMSVTRTYPK